jgi:tRNA(Ile2) C34 agmatinyltransferase TiaS
MKYCNHDLVKTGKNNWTCKKCKKDFRKP